MVWRRSGFSKGPAKRCAGRRRPGLERKRLRRRLAGDGAEVLHVGAEDNGVTAGGGFDDVLAALPHEAFADENGGRNLVEPFQFARGIDDEAIVRFGGLLEMRGDLRAEHELDLLATGEVRDLARALDVPRDDDQKQIGKFPAQIREDIEEDFLLAGVGTARHEDRLRGRDADLLEQLDGVDFLHVGVGMEMSYFRLPSCGRGRAARRWS